MPALPFSTYFLPIDQCLLRRGGEGERALKERGTLEQGITKYTYLPSSPSLHSFPLLLPIHHSSPSLHHFPAPPPPHPSITGTTRPAQNNEQQGVDYNFISPEEFKRMEKNGDFLESGVFEGHFYGTPKPPADPPSNSTFPTYARSPANAGYLPRDPVAAPAEVLPSVPRYRTGPAAQAPQVPRNLGPLPPNWEIAYTENNEKYFIE